MNIINSTDLIERTFWLYYAQGLIYNSMQEYSRALHSFNTAINYENYGNLLVSNPGLLNDELLTHQELFDSTDKKINSKISSVDEVAIKSNAQILLLKYQQVIKCFEDIIECPLADFPCFIEIFDMVSGNSISALVKDLQLGHAHYHKAITLVELKRHTEAITSLNQTNKLLPDFYQAYAKKANIYSIQKKYKKVVEEYSKAIELMPDNRQLYFDRSVALFELGLNDKAKKDYKKWQMLMLDN
jgi:tetratricopeptide (TPR) repeat protein